MICNIKKEQPNIRKMYCPLVKLNLMYPKLIEMNLTNTKIMSGTVTNGSDRVADQVSISHDRIGKLEFIELKSNL